MKTFKKYLNEQSLGLKLVTDIDGVLLSFNEGFVKWMSKNHPEEKINQGQTWDYGIGQKRAFVFVKEFWASPELGKLPVFDGAKQGLNKLGKLFEVHMVTAVPAEFTKAREKNLRGFQRKTLTLKGENKIQYILDNIKPTVAIEDKPENILKLHQGGVDVYWPKIPLTRGVAVGTPYKNWKELVKIIERKYQP